MFRASVPVQERLKVTFRFLATRDTYTRLQNLFQISKQKISQSVPEGWLSMSQALKENLQVNECLFTYNQQLCKQKDVLEPEKNIYK